MFVGTHRHAPPRQGHHGTSDTGMAWCSLRKVVPEMFGLVLVCGFPLSPRVVLACGFLLPPQLVLMRRLIRRPLDRLEYRGCFCNSTKHFVHYPITTLRPRMPPNLRSLRQASVVALLPLAGSLNYCPRRKIVVFGIEVHLLRPSKALLEKIDPVGSPRPLAGRFPPFVVFRQVFFLVR